VALLLLGALPLSLGLLSFVWGLAFAPGSPPSAQTWCPKGRPLKAKSCKHLYVAVALVPSMPLVALLLLGALPLSLGLLSFVWGLAFAPGFAVDVSLNPPGHQTHGTH